MQKGKELRLADTTPLDIILLSQAGHNVGEETVLPGTREIMRPRKIGSKTKLCRYQRTEEKRNGRTVFRWFMNDVPTSEVGGSNGSRPEKH